MKEGIRRTVAHTIDRAARMAGRRPGGDRPGERPTAMTPHRRLVRRVDALEQEVTECRKLNQRLSDIIDVVTEVLVPAVDRDDERLRAALKRLDAVGGVDPATAQLEKVDAGTSRMKVDADTSTE